MFLLLFLVLGGELRVTKKGDEVILTNIPRDFAPKKKTSSNENYQKIINRVCQKYNMDPKLINLVIERESGFNPRARSPKGAIGLMQLMPETAKKLGVKEPYDPEQNIEGGVKYLRILLNRYKSLDLALAAYHAGPAAVDRAKGLPKIKETITYVNDILNRYSPSFRDRIYCKIKRGETIFTNIP